ncbi:MAG TPA: hypothetical protein VHE33_05395, partial [Acidobacteriaceae bacterium]|nr:hypothetical protein [Acidobacteriaceae bacterium]
MTKNQKTPPRNGWLKALDQTLGTGRLSAGRMGAMDENPYRAPKEEMAQPATPLDGAEPTLLGLGLTLGLVIAWAI